MSEVETIKNIIENIDPALTIKKITPQNGGDINQAFLVETNKSLLFVKTNKGVPSDFFQKEAMGLKELQSTGEVHVPDVLYYNQESDKEQFLVLSYVSGSIESGTEAKLGRQLARMHQVTKSFYGLSYDNYLGTIPQKGERDLNWAEFYRDKRLKSQIEMASKKGYLSDEKKERHLQLLSHLKKWIPDDPGASVLHGDLWGGNWIAGSNGEPYLIDPAVVYGDREMDLAMTALFGGFGSDFYEAYESEADSKLNREIWPLYQLYYLYMHLNTFGQSYLGATERIVTRFLG
jgi:fructosamine-3-kinase